MIIGKGNSSTRRNPALMPIFTTNPIQAYTELNTNGNGEKPATSCRSHDKAEPCPQSHNALRILINKNTDKLLRYVVYHLLLLLTQTLGYNFPGTTLQQYSRCYNSERSNTVKPTLATCGSTKT